MSKFFQKYATWRNVAFLLGLIALLNVLLFWSFNSNPELNPLDMRFSYSPEKAYQILSEYSDDERSRYILVELTLDILYPIVYSLCISFVLFLLHKSTRIAKVPLLLIAIDFAENILIVTLLSYYPTKLPTIVSFASFFTSMKWLLLLICALLLVYGLVRKIFKLG